MSNVAPPKRCPQFRKCRQYLPCDIHRPTARARGYDNQWAALRRAFLATYPRCQATGCFENATEVDHKDGRGPKGPRGYDWDNLQALCKQHHSALTRGDQG